jgi:hypothetical protein
MARDHHGAHAISLTCWTVWIGANASTALYAWVRLAHVALASVSAFNTACCLLVFAIAGYKRQLHEISRRRAIGGHLSRYSKAGLRFPQLK